MEGGRGGRREGKRGEEGGREGVSEDGNRERKVRTGVLCGGSYLIQFRSICVDMLK